MLQWKHCTLTVGLIWKTWAWWEKHFSSITHFWLHVVKRFFKNADREAMSKENFERAANTFAFFFAKSLLGECSVSKKTKMVSGSCWETELSSSSWHTAIWPNLNIAKFMIENGNEILDTDICYRFLLSFVAFKESVVFFSSHWYSRLPCIKIASKYYGRKSIFLLNSQSPCLRRHDETIVYLSVNYFATFNSIEAIRNW